MRTGRPKAALMVSAEQRGELERWVLRRSTAQALALRARIILSCAEGGNNKDVANRLGMSRLTIGRWRSRFIRSGVARRGVRLDFPPAILHRDAHAADGVCGRSRPWSDLSGAGGRGAAKREGI